MEIKLFVIYYRLALYIYQSLSTKNKLQNDNF